MITSMLTFFNACEHTVLKRQYYLKRNQTEDFVTHLHIIETYMLILFLPETLTSPVQALSKSFSKEQTGRSELALHRACELRI